MRVLVVARHKKNGFAPFVTEQVEALEKTGVECRTFPVKKGYLRQWPALRLAIRKYKPDIVHAHYGLCGLIANLQRKVPVVTTYHGSDINESKVRWLSRIATRLSRFNIFVSQRLLDKVAPVKNSTVIPCGINLEDYPLVEKAEARRQLGLRPDGKYVLFAGSFDNPVKDAPLAKEVIERVPGVDLFELKDYSRPQVALRMQAIDAFLMTSFSEGSPQVIKEALACGCPIVSVDVGDVRERVEGVAGCYVTETRSPEELADLLHKALAFSGRTNGKERILAEGLDNLIVAKSLMEIYEIVGTAR